MCIVLFLAPEIGIESVVGRIGGVARVGVTLGLFALPLAFVHRPAVVVALFGSTGGKFGLLSIEPERRSDQLDERDDGLPDHFAAFLALPKFMARKSTTPRIFAHSDPG